MEAISGRKTIQEIAADHAIHLGLPRFRGQVSGLHGLECTGVDELLLVVDRAEVTDR